LARLFGTQGFRGIVNETLTPTMVEHLGRALAGLLGGKGTVAIAWDSRISSEVLSQAVSAGIRAGGCDIYQLGLIPTPMLSFAVPRLGCSAGVMVTASHNPPEFNGIKLWQGDGAPFTPEDERRIEKGYSAAGELHVQRSQCGHLRAVKDLRPRYVHELTQQVNRDSIRRRGIRLVADCGGGAACVVAPNLLERLGCEVERLYCTPDGRIEGRPAEPREQNLAKLIQRVHEKDADLGVAWDGDADRAIFVTHKSRYLMGDRSFALAAYHRLQAAADRPQKTIVTQVATSDVIRDVAEAVGANIAFTRIGEPHIVAMMKKTKAQIGGEENGGVIYPTWSWTREGMLTPLTILDFMAQEEQSLEQLDRRFPSYAQVKERVPCEEGDKARLLDRVAAMTPTDAERDTLDGVKLRYGDGWLLLRPSGTEPLFRIFAEAKTRARAKALARLGIRLVTDAYTEIVSTKK
jgi:phosphomannomutase/phosphoglucomutase